MLANRGYDVWLGNKHSRRHSKYDPNKGNEFWEFTFQHMADFDLPAIFSYVNALTHQKIHYIGQPTALSKNNPIIEDLIDKFIALGPVAFINHATSNLTALFDKSALIQWFHLRKTYEFLPEFGWLMSDVGIVFCATFPKVCSDLLAQVFDADPSLDNYHRYDVMVGYDPSRTSVLNLEHRKQAQDGKSFQAFDYISAGLNNAHYGQPTPPHWDLGRIRVPVHLMAGSSDEAADPIDVNYLWNKLAEKAKGSFKTQNSGHMTFMWGKEATPWMTDIFRLFGQ